MQTNSFEFTKVTEETVKNEFLELNTKNSSASGSNPGTMLKQSLETYLPFLKKQLHWSITECEFPCKLEKLEAIFLYKNQDPLKKEGYRSVNLLLHVSKVSEHMP